MKRCSKRVRLMARTALTTGIALSLSAIAPAAAEADIPLLGPALGIGGKVLGWCGGVATHAAGDVALDGVKAILDWIFGGQLLDDAYDPPLFRRLRAFHDEGKTIKASIE